MLIDTHCHLDLLCNTFSLDAIVNRAEAAGVRVFINPAVDLESSFTILSLINKYPCIFAAVGIHPNSACYVDSVNMIKIIEELADQPKVVAIGEIGLDYFHTATSNKEQHQLLSRQLTLACEKHYPVILHSRDSMPDMINILHTFYKQKTSFNGDQCNGVMHAFEGDLDQALEVISLGFMIGLGGPITYRNATQKQLLARDLPLDSIVLETDAPYLSPEPLRGKNNEPANIKIILEKLSLLRECDIKQVEMQTTINAKRLFRIGEAIVCD
jgi:TatD DNase family protein